jgi:hypothetical protein
MNKVSISISPIDALGRKRSSLQLQREKEGLKKYINKVYTPIYY